MLLKVLKAVELVVNYSVTVRGNKEYRTMTLAEWLALKTDERPVGQIKVTNVPVEQVEAGQVEVPGLNKAGYALRCRIIRPKQGDSWSPFVDATLVKETPDIDIDKALDEFFA